MIKTEKIKWNINENFKPFKDEIVVHIEVISENDFNITIDGQKFDFTSWREYICFHKGFKYAWEISQKN